MKRKFVVTQNVKRFVDLMDTLQNAPPNLPKMALVYGDFGLGKSQTIMWWVTNNDAIYVRCNHKISARWLLTEIVEELDDVPTYLTSLLFKQIEDKLRERPKVLVVDEVCLLQAQLKLLQEDELPWALEEDEACLQEDHLHPALA